MTQLLRALAFTTLLFGLVAGSPADDELIEHRILEIDATSYPVEKIAYYIEVSLIDGRLPTAEEMSAVARHRVATRGDSDQIYVFFLLPGMEMGAGAYGLAPHTPRLGKPNPNFDVRVQHFILKYLPEYAHLAE